MEQQSNKKTEYIITNKFGDLNINLANTVTLPYGLIGMPQYKSFCITKTDIEHLQQFKIMQSLDEDNLSFLILPLEISNPVIEASDIEFACKHTEIDQKDAFVVLIASTKVIEEKKVITVNAKAPVIVDVKRKIAIQYVLTKEYSTQFVIT